MAKALFCFSIFLYYYVFLLSCSSSALDHNGFSVELIHRDSPKSPFYNPSETHSQRLINSFRRSISRAAAHFSSADASSVQSTVFNNRGEYLMTLSIGTPPFPILAVADTGSDLTWTQCKPCTKCYNQTAPLFNPKSSKTYKDAFCSSRLCDSATGATTSCSGTDSLCHYSLSYGDQSFTNGNLATDTVTLSSTSGRPVSFPKHVIGCGHNNGGTFDEKASGIVGLGNGADSLISQIDSSIGAKFSYCLLPLTLDDDQKKNSSKLNFGEKAVVSGRGVVTTPLVSGTYGDTFYYLSLEGITVGSNESKRYIKFKTSTGIGKASSNSEGNIIIDSGTTLTMLSNELYSELELEVEQEMTKSHLKRVEDPDGFLSLCYKSQTNDFYVPIITMHFKGDADVKLSGLNTFVRVSEEVVCFAIVPAQDLSIYGNLAQMNFMVGYDRQKETLSFKQTDCTLYN